MNDGYPKSAPATESRTCWALAAIVIAFFVVALSAPPAQAETVEITGTLEASDTDQTGRINRDGVISGCAAGKTNTLFNATVVNSDSHSLTNPRPEPACIVVEVDHTGCAPHTTQVNAYSSYAPASPGNNTIGDLGFSSTDERTFGFPVAAEAEYTLVVHEITPGSGCPEYKLRVTDVPLATVSEGDGIEPTDIQEAVDQFRAELGGGSVPGPHGSFGGARREIDWEDVPDLLAAPQFLPGDHYNTSSPRGLVLSGPSADFRVSADSTPDPPGTPPLFGNVHPDYTEALTPFSGERLFSPPIASPDTTLTFFEPGTETPGPTRGFGAVFVGAGKNQATQYLKPMDAEGNPLGFYVPPTPTLNDMRFLGLSLPTPSIHSLVGSVGISNTISESGSTAVVYDDFIYGEPGGPTPPGDPTPPGGDPTPPIPAGPVPPSAGGPIVTPGPTVRPKATIKRVVRLDRRGRANLGSIVCGDSACTLRKGTAYLQVVQRRAAKASARKKGAKSKKRYAVAARYAGSLASGARTGVRVVAPPRAIKALKRARRGTAVVLVPVSDASGRQVVKMATKVTPPKVNKRKKRRAR